MIEIEYIDNKPQVIINKKRIKTWDKLEEGCVYAEVGDEKITVFDFENIKISTIPNKLIILIFIKEVLEYYRNKTDLVYKQTFQKLNGKIIDEILLSETASLKFRFPKHLRDICKQYLSYFGKFLLDHNIECQLSLMDKNDVTYMTINVDESQIDIEKLKQALVGYFALPIAPQENINFDTYNIATQQLIANIEHLKSQLRLANATIAQYENNSLANSSKPVEYVLLDSLDENSKLKLYDGLIQISKTLKLKFFGVEIELSIPKLIDRFKNNSKNIE